MKTLNKFVLLGLITLIATACTSDDDNGPTIVNEEEVITTVIVTLSPEDGSTPIVLSSVDADGDGPNSPVVNISGPLSANTSYMGAVQFLNETESPAEDITEEVQDEADEHQVIYTLGTGLEVTVTYNDFDGNNNPLGTAITLATGSASQGNLTVTLRHEPNKPNDGSLNDAGGETDVQVIFPVDVQ